MKGKLDFLIPMITGVIFSLLIVLTSLFLFDNSPLLLHFIFFYAVVSFFYLFFRYIFAVINYPTHSFRHQKRKKCPSVSIVIPCYNEEKGYLEECIENACKVKYPGKEVIMIDDGSPDPECWNTISRLREKYGFKAYKLDRNMGKRKAMAFGFRQAKGEILIAGDSDTIIASSKSIKKLVEPFSDRHVGAVSGCIMVKNTEDSIMTKIQDARYWLAFFLEKSSQNFYDSVTCASGPFSAYKREYVMKFLDEWENQVFLGQECTYGDDRGLTTFLLKRGYDVKFARDAVAYTNVPETLPKFMRQQIRWKKSFIRENWYMLGFIFIRNPLMILEFFLFWVVFILGFIAKLTTILFVISGRAGFIDLFIMILFVATLHYIYAFLKSPGTRGYYGIIYGLLNEFLISWLIFPAFFSLRDTKWGTR